MQAWIGKLLALVAEYLFKAAMKEVMDWFEKRKQDKKNEEAIREAMSNENRKDAAARLNDVFSG